MQSETAPRLNASKNRLAVDEAVAAFGSAECIATIVDKSPRPDAPCVDAWSLHTRRGKITAYRAASCLIALEAGDTVLFKQAGNRCWITDVLMRAGEGPCIVRPAGGAALQLQAPAVEIRADESCRITAPGIEMASDHFALRTRSARIAVSALHLVGHWLHVAAQHVNACAEQLALKCRTRTTQVEEIDSLQARHLVTAAEESSTLDAGQVVVNARETVRVDGKRILMG